MHSACCCHSVQFLAIQDAVCTRTSLTGNSLKRCADWRLQALCRAWATFCRLTRRRGRILATVRQRLLLPLQQLLQLLLRRLLLLLQHASDAAPRWLSIHWPDIVHHSLTIHWPHIAYKLTNHWLLADHLLTRYCCPFIDHTRNVNSACTDQTLTHWLTIHWPLVDHPLTVRGRSAESTEDSFDFSGNDTALVNETTCCSNLTGWSMYGQSVVNKWSINGQWTVITKRPAAVTWSLSGQYKWSAYLQWLVSDWSMRGHGMVILCLICGQSAVITRRRAAVTWAACVNGSTLHFGVSE